MQALTKRERIEEITRRLIEFYNPVRVYLFGSEGRGDASANSDLDFLVVVRDDTPANRLRPAAMAQVLAGIETAEDVIAWPQSDFDGRAAHVKASLPATVVREGRILDESGPLAR